ncbi:hypothetical protein Avbf_13619 [Armadillidium vulgare]|nr:hypothetical protein Avbf_13619 [Armadillidium vulgare]
MRHSILMKKTWKVAKVLKGNMKPCVLRKKFMEENGQGHGQDFGQSSGLDLSQMKISYPIINANEKIEEKDDKLNIKEEDVSDDRIYEVKENTLYIKEEIMENGEDQGDGFDQSSGLDESQTDICDVNYEDEEDTEFVNCTTFW